MSDQLDEAPIMHQLQEALTAALDKFREQGLTFGEAVGALETVKLDLYLEQQTDWIRKMAIEP